MFQCRYNIKTLEIEKLFKVKEKNPSRLEQMKISITNKVSSNTIYLG